MAFKQHKMSVNFQLKEFMKAGRITKEEIDAIMDEADEAAKHGLRLGREDGTNNDVTLNLGQHDKYGNIKSFGSYKRGNEENNTHCGYKPIEGAPGQSKNAVEQGGLETTRAHKKPKVMTIEELVDALEEEELQREKEQEEEEEDGTEKQATPKQTQREKEDKTKMVTPPTEKGDNDARRHLEKEL